MHRVALEFRSGIWLMFYETLRRKGIYKQELLRIFGHRISTKIRYDTAEKAALFVISDRKVNAPLIVRDDSLRNQAIRPA